MIDLRPMSPEEFQRYLKPAVAQYARMHKRAGNLTDRQAMVRARNDYAQLLPKGVRSAGQFLYALVRKGEAIGMAWFEIKRKQGRRRAFIFDFQLRPSQRGKGFGRQSLRALEREARRLGAEEVGLHVFGHNLRARGLYEASGYRYTSMHMVKALR